MKKLLLFGLVFILCVSFASADLNDGLSSYWGFNETSGNLIDFVSGVNGTLQGATQQRLGKNGFGYHFDSGNDAVNITKSAPYFKFNNMNFSISTWIYINSSTFNNGDKIYSFGIPNRFMLDKASLTGKYEWYDDSASIGSSVNAQSNQWVHYLLRGYANNTFEIWINGTHVNTTYSANLKNYTAWTLGRQIPEAMSWFGGNLDEFGYWNKTLTPTDISELWNSGTGTFYPFLPPPSMSVNLVSPSNNTINNTLSYNFYYNVTYYGESLRNCSLYTNHTGNWSVRISNATAVPNATNMYFGVAMPSDGTYIWNIGCWNGTNNEVFATNNYTLTVDTTSPIITPETNLGNNKTFAWNGSINTYINFSDEREIYSVNVTFGNGTIIYNVTNYGSTFLKVNITQNISNIVSQTINAKVCDSHTATSIADVEKVNIDKTKQQLEYVVKTKWFFWKEEYIRIYPKDASAYSSPTTEKQFDRYPFTFNKKEAPKDYETFVVESSDFIDIPKSQKYGGHLVIPSIGQNGFWVDFENTEATKYVIRRISNTKIEVDVYGMKSKEMIFNSVGELNCVEATYYIGNLNPTTIYSDNVLVNSNNTVSLTITKDTITMTDINATLYYNNTAYYVGATPNFSTSVISPNLSLTTENSNVSLYWYVGIDGNYYNLTQYTQTVNNFYLDNCTNANMVAINFSYWDEDNSSMIDLNVDVDIEYNYNDIDKTLLFSRTAVNTTQICIYPNWTTFNGSYEITYASSDYPQRKYIVEDTYFSNATQQIKLYGLYVDNGIYANFNIINSLGVPIKEVLGTMSKSGITMETELSDGSGAMSFWQNPDVTYQYKFTKDGCGAVIENLRVTDSNARTVTMNCGEAGTYTQNYTYAAGIQYGFTPTADLMNGTDYNFVFNMTSAYWTITSCDMYLRDYSGSNLASVAGTYTGTTCSATIPYNTGNLSSIRSYVVYTLNSSSSISAYKDYTVYYFYTGQFSLRNFLDDLESFTSSGFNQFSRMFLAFIIIFIITAMVSYKLDIVDSEAIVMIIIMLTWSASYIGWLNLTTYAGITNAFIQKYIIAILVTLLGGAYIMKRHMD
jgi:hypothetical protein